MSECFGIKMVVNQLSRDIFYGVGKLRYEQKAIACRVGKIQPGLIIIAE